MSAFSGLHPQLQPWAAALFAQSRTARITSVFRSNYEQTRLYRRYVNGQSAYPVAPPGLSYHQYGRAWDMIAPQAELYRLGAIWRAWGGTWSPSDDIHFQA